MSSSSRTGHSIHFLRIQTRWYEYSGANLLFLVDEASMNFRQLYNEHSRSILHREEHRDLPSLTLFLLHR